MCGCPCDGQLQRVLVPASEGEARLQAGERWEGDKVVEEGLEVRALDARNAVAQVTELEGGKRGVGGGREDGRDEGEGEDGQGGIVGRRLVH